MSKYKINKNKTNKLTNMEENNIEAIYGKGFLGINLEEEILIIIIITTIIIHHQTNIKLMQNDLYGDLDVSAESQQLRKAEAKMYH